MYPFTMLFLVLMSVFLLIMTDQYLAEKRFAKETEKIRLREYYMLCSLKEAETMMQAGSLPSAGTISYLGGTVSYQRQPLTQAKEQIFFTLRLDSGERGAGTGIYDKEKGRVVKWMEK